MKRLLLLSVLFLSLFSFVGHAQPAAEEPAGGDGSINNPYQIANYKQLLWIAQEAPRWDKHYRQTADIVFPLSGADDIRNWDTNQGWSPIGTGTLSGPSGGTYGLTGTNFTGSYDGQNHTISNLYINRPGQNQVGLFGHIGNVSEGDQTHIKNVHLREVEVTGARAAGSLIGRVTGSQGTLIEGCSASGSTMRNVTGDAAVGGLVGSSNSYRTNPGNVAVNPLISRSWADIDVAFSDKEPQAALPEKYGGLAGCSQRGRIHNSYALGSVTVVPVDYDGTEGRPEKVGGLAGCILVYGQIINCYSTGQVTVGTEVSLYGGLLGNMNINQGEVTGSVWNLTTSGQTTSEGGSGVTGLTDTEFSIQSEWEAAGFVFGTGIWSWDNNGPKLVDIPNNTYISWTGTNSNAWNLVDNWSDTRIPSEYDVVLIPDVANKPVVSTGTEVLVQNVTIEQGSSLTLEADVGLYITGSLINYTGAGGLVLMADETGSKASLINNSEGVVASVQQHIPASRGATWPSKKYTQATEWFYISQPVMEQDISAFLTGLTSYDLYRWSESDDTWYNHKAAGFNQTQFSMTEGYLFAAPVIHTPTYQGELFAGTFRMDNLSASGSGNPNTGTPQYYAAGWHLLGNPYPSGLVFDPENWTMDGLVQTLKIWSNETGTYADCTAGFIPPMTAFFVQVDAGFDNDNTLVVPASTRATVAPITKSLERDRIVIAAIGVESQMKQQSIIRLETDTKEGFDARYDSRFLAGYAPRLYAVTETDRLSTLSVRDTHPERFIPFAFEKNDGESAFQILLEENVGDTELYLLDKKLNVCHKLGFDTPYAFASEADDDPLRFELHFQEVQVETGIDEELLQPQNEIFVHGQTLHMTFGKEAGDRTLEVFDINGRRLIHQTLGTGTGHTVQLGFQTGIYIARITSTDETATKRIFVQ